jgi:diguanylate cyclase (GGDEF)-like protein/PAS domain S-box-containing protein
MKLDGLSFEKFFDLSSDMLAVSKRSGEFTRTNPAFRNVLGWEEIELEGRSTRELIVHEERLAMKSAFRNLAKGHPILFAENHMHQKDGSVISVRWTAYPDMKEGLVYFFGRSTDEELMQNENFRMALNASPTGILVVQKDGKISYTTPLVNRIFAYEDNELFGKEIEDLLPLASREKHIEHRKDFAEDPYLRPMGLKSMNLWGMRKDKSNFRVDVGLNPIFTTKGVVVIASVIDISEREKDLEELRDVIKNLKDDVLKLERLASLDDLTQLLNRRTLMKYAELNLYLAHQDQEVFSFAMLDVDNFKSYNDQFGHPAGDIVLNRIGKIIAEETRKIDISARYGGEEFAILMPQTNAEEANRVISRVCKAIEKFPWKHRHITISAGIATYQATVNRPSPEIIPQFMILADEALYRSKHDGKNRCTHFDDIPKHELSSHYEEKDS